MLYNTSGQTLDLLRVVYIDKKKPNIPVASQNYSAPVSLLLTYEALVNGVVVPLINFPKQLTDIIGHMIFTTPRSTYWTN